MHKLNFLKLLISLTLMSAFISSLSAASKKKKKQPATVIKAEGFEAHKMGNKMAYRLKLPKNMKKGKSYPLVIFLHGIGCVGTDNTKQMKFAAPVVNALEKAGQEAIVMLPQAPKRWDWKTQPVLLKLVKTIKEKYPVNEKQMYLMGFSAGAMGTWGSIAVDPNLFAAAVPISGGALTENAPKLVNMPVWAFHGKKDTVVKSYKTSNMVEAIKKADGKLIKYTEYPDGKHECFTALKDPKLWQWLFAQKK